jgi:hypothetical protein
MLTMFFIKFGEDCYVIQIDDHKLILFSNEGNVHGSLKIFSYIHQSKGNFGIHKCAPRGGEGHLLSIFRENKDLIVAKKSINHGNLQCTYYPLQYMFHLWQRVIILLSAPVQVSKIDTQSDFSILFPYWKQVGHPFRISQRDNDLGVHQLIYLPFHNRKQHRIYLS